MKIEKLPSGSYRIRKMYKGKTYTVVFDCKPTQKEAMQAMAAELDKVKEKHDSMTFQAAAEKYIDSKKNVISPSTTLGYKKIVKQLPETFLTRNIYDITSLDVQKEIDCMSKKCSPKTVRNRYGFISAVLGAFYSNLKLNITLPQKIKNEPYIPSREDVKKILEKVKGTEFEIPITLACYGMRRSEICALTLDDLDADIIHINKALVQNDSLEWVIKTTKTTSSTRNIVIPVELANKIREKGYIYKGHPNQLLKHLTKLEKELDIPHFSLHKLRHYFASEMSTLGVPDADILRLGGWETDSVMKSVYRHSMMEKEENAKREAAEKLRNALLP